MRVLGRTVSVPRLVLAALAAALLVALVVGVATTGAAFAPFNPDWQGASELRSTAAAAGAEPIVATETDRYRSIEANDSVAFVLAPAARSASDRQAMRSFADSGGRLVIATGDPAAGNALLGGLGVDVRVGNATLRDDVENLHGPAFPQVTTTASHRTVRNATGLALNYGTALRVGEDARPLANSSSFSYLDYDANGAPGPGERLATRPVVAVQPVGAGDVIVVSDPSVFINAMLEHDPNRQFTRNLVAEQDRVVLDRTEDGVPPLRAVLLWLRGGSVGPIVVGVLIVGIALAWERRLHRRPLQYVRRVRGSETTRGAAAGATTAPPGATDGRSSAWQRDGEEGRPRSPVDRSALEAYLAAEYPEWDPDRRARVLGGVMADDQERGDDATVE